MVVVVRLHWIRWGLSGLFNSFGSANSGVLSSVESWSERASCSFALAIFCCQHCPRRREAVPLAVDFGLQLLEGNLADMGALAVLNEVDCDTRKFSKLLILTERIVLLILAKRNLWL